MRKVDPDSHAARRGMILQAARSCFADNGFQGTSTAEICRAAGMSSGNLFHYFPSKQAIIVAIVEEEGAETSAYFATLSARDDLFPALLEFVDVILSLAGDAKYARLALETVAEAARNTEIARLLARNDAELRQALEDLLRSAATRGQIDAGLEARDIADWLMTWIDGTFSRISVDPAYDLVAQRRLMQALLRRLLNPTNATEPGADRS